MRHAKLLPIALVSFSFGCTGARTAEEYPDAVAADPDHYSVEFENDVVRLVRIAYGPGEQSVMHQHPASCAVALGDATWRMTDAEGTVTDDAGALGDVDCPEASVHLPENTGSEASELILIEFKEGAMAGSASWFYPDAVTADPDHYSVEFENDVARLLRIRYGAGETSVMHHHPASCNIFLINQPITFELPNSEVQEMPTATTGHVQCTDADVHLPTNTGEDAFELVLLELKGREAFQN